MEFKSFTSLVKEEVEKRAGSEYNVMVNDVIKNNGVILSGLSMMSENSNVSPTIYLNNFYEDYERGVLSLDAVVSEVFDVYNKFKVEMRMDMEFFTDYNKIKNRIIFKVINTERNKELLMDVPHIEIHDLSIIFQCLMSDERLGNATITIHNSHMKLWNVTKEELYEVAMLNTPQLQKYNIRNIVDLLKEMDIFKEMAFDMEADNMPSIPMYVLTNEAKTQGSACILYPDLLKDLSTAFNQNLIILPSSIHEVIIIPDIQDNNFENLKQMVIDINRTQVAPEEILSDSVYYYNRELEIIEIF